MRHKATTAANLPTIIEKLLEENVDDPVNTTIDMKLSEENVDSAFDTTTTSDVFDSADNPIDTTRQLKSSASMKLSEDFFCDAVDDTLFDPLENTTNKDLLDAVDGIISDSVETSFTFDNIHTSTKEKPTNDNIAEPIDVDNGLPTRDHFLTFPFIAGVELNETSVDLSLCNVGADPSLSHSAIIAIQGLYTKPCKKLLKFSERSLDRLNPGQCFNISSNFDYCG